jgi:hypothetical protein
MYISNRAYNNNGNTMSKLSIEKAKVEICIESVENLIEAANKKIESLKLELEAHKAELQSIIEAEKNPTLQDAEFVLNWHEGTQFFDSEDIAMDRSQLESALKLVASFAPATEEQRGYNKFKFTVKVAGSEASYRIDLNKHHSCNERFESLIIEALWGQCIESILFGRMKKEDCLSYALLKNELGKDLLDQNLEDWQADYDYNNN